VVPKEDSIRNIDLLMSFFRQFNKKLGSQEIKELELTRVQSKITDRLRGLVKDVRRVDGEDFVVIGPRIEGRITAL
jgi:hypothetical protein